MKKEIDIKITYLSPKQSIDDDYLDANIFLDEIKKEYEVSIDKKYAGLGGGLSLYEFFVHILAEVSLKDAIVGGIITNLAYDILKSGSKISLKKFFEAYKMFRQKNEEYNSLDISTIKFEFQDVTIVLYGIFKDSLPNVISEITQVIVENYEIISEYDDRLLKEIHIPIIQRVAEEYKNMPEQLDMNSKYTYPNKDEITELNKSNYFKFWGLKYYFQHKKYLYNLQTNKITLEEWIDPTDNIYSTL